MILVTGSEGLIGTELCRAFERERRPFRRYDLKLGQDILDRDQLASAMGCCSAVVHLAAISRIMPAERDPVRTYCVNVTGTENVVRAAREVGAKVVYASSREVYGTTTQPARESDRLHPDSFYGVTKAYAEQAVEGVILRLSNVYGGTNDHPDRVVPAFMRAALNDESAVVEGGQGAFDFVHVDDVVRAIQLALMAGEDERVTCNVVTGTSTRLMVLAYMCGEVTGRRTRIMLERQRAHGAKCFHGCPALAESELGWRAQIDLREGLARYARLVGPASCK